MKWIIRISVVLVVLLIVAAVAANFVLKNHLTAVLDHEVLPAVQEQLGVPVRVGDASVAVMQGAMVVKDVSVSNPPGFADPTLFAVNNVDLALAWKPLLTKGIAQVDHLRVEDAELWILRNADRRVNLKVLSERLQPEKPSEKVPETAEQAPPADEGPKTARPVQLPKARLKSLAVNTTVHYRDLALDPNQPVEINLQNQLTVLGLSTVVGEETEWASVSLTGNLASDADLCVTDLTGKVAPFEDPLRMSFELAGDIGKVNIDAFKSYLEQAGIVPENLALDVKLVCNDGVFDPEESVIRLHMDNITFKGKIKEEMPKEVSYLSRLSVPIRIRGTLAEPQPDGLMRATLAALITNIKDNVGAVAAGIAGNALAEELQKRGGLENILGEETSRQLTESLQNTPLAKSPLFKGILGDDEAKTPESDAPEPAETEPPAKAEDQLKSALRGLLNRSDKDAAPTSDPGAEETQEQPAKETKELFKKRF